MSRSGSVHRSASENLGCSNVGRPPQRTRERSAAADPILPRLCLASPASSAASAITMRRGLTYPSCEATAPRFLIPPRPPQIFKNSRPSPGCLEMPGHLRSGWLVHNPHAAALPHSCPHPPVMPPPAVPGVVWWPSPAQPTTQRPVGVGSLRCFRFCRPFRSGMRLIPWDANDAWLCTMDVGMCGRCVLVVVVVWAWDWICFGPSGWACMVAGLRYEDGRDGDCVSG